jgi:hypothetical protein
MAERRASYIQRGPGASGVTPSRRAARAAAVRVTREAVPHPRLPRPRGIADNPRVSAGLTRDPQDQPARQTPEQVLPDHSYLWPPWADVPGR